MLQVSYTGTNYSCIFSVYLHQTECGNFRGISLVAHAGNVHVKVVAGGHSDHIEAAKILPEM